MKFQALILICNCLNATTGFFTTFFQRLQLVGTPRVAFFYGNTFDDRQMFSLKNANQILNQNEFDLRKPTVLYVHGYYETYDDFNTILIVSSYLSRRDHNVLALDWGKIAAKNYVLQALPRVIELGTELGETILYLINYGLDLQKIHIVGHSMGAQIASLTARNVKKLSNGRFKLPRITGLDPAFMLFYPGILTGHISKDDADFVDIYHGDQFFYGAPISSGTVDFWPNGGRALQPGCPLRNFELLSDNVCSHERPIRFWAESVASKFPRKFKAIKCRSWNDFKSRSCNWSSVIEMGINCPASATGDYFLQTNANFPFAKGISGTAFIRMI